MAQKAGALEYTSVPALTLQNAATHCNNMTQKGGSLEYTSVPALTLQNAATYCNALQQHDTKRGAP